MDIYNNILGINVSKVRQIEEIHSYKDIAGNQELLTM